MTLLTQNGEMRRDGIWNFTLPAWVVDTQDGHFNVCPNAGACAKLCYARNGTYLFPAVRAKHMQNLNLVRYNPDWINHVYYELSASKFRPTGQPRFVPGLTSIDHLSPFLMWWLQSGGQAVRVHDSGDFFNREYLHGWLRVAQWTPDVLFYAYTKEVAMLKDTQLPDNFLIIYSMGGRQDHLIDPDTDRHADVFPTLEALEGAGYTSQEDSDLLAVLLPTTRVGIVANNIPHIRKRLGGDTFATAQEGRRRHAVA